MPFGGQQIADDLAHLGLSQRRRFGFQQPLLDNLELALGGVELGLGQRQLAGFHLCQQQALLGGFDRAVPRRRSSRPA